MNSVLLGQYDFVILGTHPAALWGAILLLERDLKVLVLPMLTTPATASSPIYSIPLIDEHPSHRFIPQFILDSILKDIPADQFHVTQLLTRDRRLRVFRKDNEFQEEWNFVLGKNANSELLTSVKNTLKTTGALRRGFGYYVRG